MLNKDRKNVQKLKSLSAFLDFSDMPDSTLLDQPPAANFLCMSEAFLQAERTNGRYNIPFIKVGRKVKYRLGDLRQFLESRRITHTGEGC